MGVQKTLLSAGNGVDKPKAGDNITMEYTGNLYDANAPGGKGKQFDSSVGRGDFDTKIGVGQLIKGTYITAQGSPLSERAIDANIMQVGTRASSEPLRLRA
jgi:FKBP-type peptidyl-prolyl cis-trans isomerase